MGAAASIEPGNLEHARSKLIEELEVECKKSENAEDVDENAKAEVIRLREWLRKIQAAAKEYEARDGGDKASSPTPLTETVTVLPDGTEITTRSDGVRIQVEKDGTKIETFLDGRRLQTNPNGRTQESFPDGTRITRTEDGKMIVKRSDGSKVQKNADGTTIEMTKEGTMIQTNPMTKIKIVVDPDGTQTQTNEADGSMIQVFPDGTKIDTDSSGCRIVKYTDGRKVQRNPNGTVIESWSDGHKIQTKVDGSRIEVFPDGRKVQTLVDGSVIEMLADGTKVRGLVGSYVCVQCWRCQTIMSVQRSAFVVSCRVCRNVILANKAQVIGTAEGTTLTKSVMRSAKELEQDVRDIFDRYDVNGSNTIDRAELGVMLAELQFPSEYFNDLFTQLDVNKNDQLEWEEFLEFYAQMQKHLTDTAQAPVLAMTQELLQEQQNALHLERGRQEKLYEELRAKGNNEEAESSANILNRLKDEYESKTAQLKQAIDAKRERQKKFLEKKLKERQRLKQKDSEQIAENDPREETEQQDDEIHKCS